MAQGSNDHQVSSFSHFLLLSPQNLDFCLVEENFSELKSGKH